MKSLNRLIASNKVKLVLKVLPTKKNWGAGDFTGKFSQIPKNMKHFQTLPKLKG